jgi:hypothetical protein
MVKPGNDADDHHGRNPEGRRDPRLQALMQ